MSLDPSSNTSAPTPGTPEWWLNRLNLLLNAQVGQFQTYRDYYEGRHNLKYADQKFRAAFGGLFATYAENICELVVDACSERMHVQGFRMGAKKDVEAADTDAWDMWQANELDAQSTILHKTSLIESVSYIGVWANPKDPKRPLMRVLDPRSTIVIADFNDLLQRRAGLRRWRDDWTGRVFAELYLPDNTFKYQALAGFAPVVPPVLPEDADRIQFGMLAGWERRAIPGEPWPLPNPLGKIPIVPFVNKPKLGMIGLSEIATTIPINDAINKLVADMLVTAAFAAFPQRYGINLPLIENKETGDVEFATGPLDPGSDRLWGFGSSEPGIAEIKFGEFSVASLDGFIKAIEQRLQMAATITRTPHHYILGGQGSFPSGEALRAVEAPLVTKVVDKELMLGESYEEVIRLGFMLRDDPRGKIMDSETIWADPENRTESQHVDALLKMGAMGVPREVLWERWGASPVEIARWKVLEAEAKAAGGIPADDTLALAAVPGAAGAPRPGMPGQPGGPAQQTTSGITAASFAASPPPGAEVTPLKVRG
jgi:Phage portal protein, SPP1 Gp6-like